MVMLAAATGIPARARAQEGDDDATRRRRPTAGIVLDNAAFERGSRSRRRWCATTSRPCQVGGYVDFGFFVPQGNGAGYVEDFGHVYFPQYAGKFGWVFLGDILAPAVNSRGEVADLGPAPGVDPLRQHQLARGARLHRQRGEPDAAFGADADRAGLGQRQLHAAHRAATSRSATRSTSTSRRSNGCRPIRSARRSSSARWSRCSASSTAIARRTGASASRRR